MLIITRKPGQAIIFTVGDVEMLHLGVVGWTTASDLNGDPITKLSTFARHAEGCRSSNTPIGRTIPTGYLDGRIGVRVLRVQGYQVQLGIDAPKYVSVARDELTRDTHEPATPTDKEWGR